MGLVSRIIINNEYGCQVIYTSLAGLEDHLHIIHGDDIPDTSEWNINLLNLLLKTTQY